MCCNGRTVADFVMDEFVETGGKFGRSGGPSDRLAPKNDVRFQAFGSRPTPRASVQNQDEVATTERNMNGKFTLTSIVEGLQLAAYDKSGTACNRCGPTKATLLRAAA
mmetsp:Transcript_104486/g.261960  ORF Transcript_104486/g.261960 Transcript_104486/m.261960 type:complete len:108 (-) Transcript_104486:22-345(-)